MAAGVSAGVTVCWGRAGHPCRERDLPFFRKNDDGLERLPRSGERRCQGISTANPEIVKAYAGLSHANTKSAHIDAKTRELLALAVAVTLRCDGCTNAHTDERPR
jgi:alkylhydroperoxidase family enzyme